jgi:hypothetical protein
MPRIQWYELEIYVNDEAEPMVVKERILGNNTIQDRLAYIGINGFATRAKGQKTGTYSEIPA